MNWEIGCSGFHYKHWKEQFYPKGLAQKNWFDYYCQHFSSLELNVTFYRFPELAFVKNWHKKSPDGFTFAVKAPRIVTHFKQFIGTEELITEFYDVMQNGLQEKLGCYLFQLPPRIAFTEERLERIINALDTNYPNVVEFRHVTWWNDAVYKKLGANNITFCAQSHPLLPDDVIVNNKLVYYRLHGVPDLYRSPYDMTFLKKIATEIKAHRKAKQAFIYFNNDIEVSAIDNAKQMQQLVCL
jgi:uncharacterized protein YecE (DUF72 family)